MNLKNQRAALVPANLRPEVESLSKAALMDIVWSFATRCCGNEGDPHLVMAELRRERIAVLAVRKRAKGDAS